jgi:hypothetical protein
MDHLVTPKYRHSKLENPTLSDLIDVFEDSWRSYVLRPARTLLDSPAGDVAAMTLVTSYFEALWIYLTGEDSNGRSREFFVNGFTRCFSCNTAGIDLAAKEIYKHIRCGLAHTGMLTRRVHFSREGAHAFYLTYPRNPDGSLSTEAPVVSIVVNPVKMYEGVLRHFDRYIEGLRQGARPDLTEPFERAVIRLWGIGEEDNVVAMTEAEFKGHE